MVTGNFNTNIKYNNKIYHIQTEVIRGNVITQVFDGGKIIHSERNKYTNYTDSVKQHKNTEKLVKTGKFIAND
jgi:hypothetical protein